MSALTSLKLPACIGCKQQVHPRDAIHRTHSETNVHIAHRWCLPNRDHCKQCYVQSRELATKQINVLYRFIATAVYVCTLALAAFGSFRLAQAAFPIPDSPAERDRDLRNSIPFVYVIRGLFSCIVTLLVAGLTPSIAVKVDRSHGLALRKKVIRPALLRGLKFSRDMPATIAAIEKLPLLPAREYSALRTRSRSQGLL